MRNSCLFTTKLNYIYKSKNTSIPKLKIGGQQWGPGNQKSHLTCRILIVKRIARWGEVFLLHDSSHWLHRNTSIWAYNCMKMMFTNVSIFTMSVNCYTIVIVTIDGVHVCHCVVVVFFFSLTNTGFAFDDHFLAVHRALTNTIIGGRILLLCRTSSMTIGDFGTSAILGFGKLKFRDRRRNYN